MNVIDGNKLASDLLLELKEIIRKNQLDLTLTVILIGNNSASLSYVKMKASDAKKLGINVNIIRIKTNTKNEDIVSLIEENNASKNVHGILLQLPIPSHLDKNLLLNTIDPDKDVDGLTSINIGRLYTEQSNLVPCTPHGCMHILKKLNLDLTGSNSVVIGRSNLVGRPMAAMLEQHNSTVTLCHSKTQNLEAICKNADIIISAAGVPNLITKEMVSSTSTIIDVGINFVGGKLTGDVNFDQIKDKVKYITPVPGGVGPMTRAMLMRNIIMAYSIQNNLKLL